MPKIAEILQHLVEFKLAKLKTKKTTSLDEFMSQLFDELVYKGVDLQKLTLAHINLNNEKIWDRL